MCGIVGYVGNRAAAPLLVAGLSKLEYRGYDSAGVAVANGYASEIAMRRSVGKLANLRHSLENAPLEGALGIGHTRWATHGAPSEINSHPHADASNSVFVVHNGIIENYAEIRAELEREGVQFRSQTDTEVLPNLIHRAYQKSGDLKQAIRDALQNVRGAYALAVLHRNHPETLVAIRQTAPLVVGLGEGENFCASDALAILSETRDIVFLENGEMAVLEAENVAIFSLESGAVREHAPEHLDWSAAGAEKGDWPHYMLKEVHEQPEVIERLLHRYCDADLTQVHLEEHLGLSDDELRGIRRIFIQACGTSWHAGLVGRLLLERLGSISVDVDTSSEFRYRNVAEHTSGAVLGDDTLVIAISQSGETADTLAGVQEARERGLKVLSIVNMPASSIVRASDGVIYTHAGPEISVASTKAYIGQIGALYLLSLHLGRVHGLIDEARMARRLAKFAELPDLMRQILSDDKDVIRVAERFWLAEHALFIGRGYGQASALEGALKLKEISYIHAEGYSAGELKHGPLALIDEKMPVVAIATQGVTYEKVLSNMQEVRARKGRLIAIAGQNDTEIENQADFVLRIPELTESFTPFLVALPLQLLAYHMAVLRGYDVDQPRNLAKSVTVE